LIITEYLKEDITLIHDTKENGNLGKMITVWYRETISTDPDKFSAEVTNRKGMSTYS